MDSCSVVPLSGTGTDLTPCCSESQATFAYGLVEIDASSVDTLFITNCDPDCTLTANPDMADSTEYWVSWVSEGWDQWTLDPSEICSLEITFIPTSAGEKLDTLTWGQDSCDAVYLSGTGLNVADCSLSVASVTFDTTTIGSTADETLMVYNLSLIHI